MDSKIHWFNSNFKVSMESFVVTPQGRAELVLTVMLVEGGTDAPEVYTRSYVEAVDVDVEECEDATPVLNELWMQMQPRVIGEAWEFMTERNGGV